MRHPAPPTTAVCRRRSDLRTSHLRPSLARQYGILLIPIFEAFADPRRYSPQRTTTRIGARELAPVRIQPYQTAAARLSSYSNGPHAFRIAIFLRHDKNTVTCSLQRTGRAIANNFRSQAQSCETQCGPSIGLLRQRLRYPIA